MLNRRSFFQSCAGAIGGLVAFAFGSQAKGEQNPQSEKVYKRSGCEHIMSFEPDTVVSMIQFEDSVIVACEHSIWKLTRDDSVFKIEKVSCGTEDRPYTYKEILGRDGPDGPPCLVTR